MENKKLILNKTTISNLDSSEMNTVKGGFDLSDYCNPPDITDQTYRC
jgi:natural product precursor